MDKEDLLNAYFEGTLSGEDQVEFDRLLENDPDFREEYEFRNELRQALRKQEHAEIRTLLSDEVNKPGKFTIGRYIPYLVAAAILLLVTVGYFYLSESVEPDSNALYLAYFEPYENVVHPIERGDEREDMLSRAFEAYENGEYKEAIRLFEALQTPDPYIDFYSGIVLLQLDREEEAVGRFRTYLNSEGVLKDRAEWYLALAYLKLGESENARELLQKISEMDAYKAEDAQQLLNQLD